MRATYHCGDAAVNLRGGSVAHGYSGAQKARASALRSTSHFDYLAERPGLHKGIRMDF